jgi:hypothetical protein
MRFMMLMVTMFCAAMCRGQAPASANSLPSVSELQNQGVDTICTYYRAVRPDYFFPLLTGNDFAFINYKFESKFVFWKKNGKNYFYFTSPDVFYPVTFTYAIKVLLTRKCLKNLLSNASTLKRNK